jgi:hypothetical protein
MASAKPADLERDVILVMMSIDRFIPAHFAAFLFKPACIECALYGQVRVVFGRVGAAPVGLSGRALDHSAVLASIMHRFRFDRCGYV